MVKQAQPIQRRRRSKRKVNFVATRFSKRKQALVQQDHAIYGNDYGILPSGTCVCSLFVSNGCISLSGVVLTYLVHIAI
jgi:hypothetical protein